MKNETNAYSEWVEAFKASLLEDVEPVSLLDYNVATFLSYSREMGITEEEIERRYRSAIRGGYRRAHERAIRKFEASSKVADLNKMEQALSDLIRSGLFLGHSVDEIGRKYGERILEAYRREDESERSDA